MKTHGSYGPKTIIQKLLTVKKENLIVTTNKKRQNTQQHQTR